MLRSFKIINIFPGILSQIYFAEQYGEFTNSLRQTAQYMQRHIKQKNGLLKPYNINRFNYCFLGILTTLKLTVLPQFTQLYDTMNVPVSRGQHLPQYLSVTYLILFYYSSTLLMISVLIIKYFFKTYRCIYKQIQFITHIPIANNYYKLLIMT